MMHIWQKRLVAVFFMLLAAVQVCAADKSGMAAVPFEKYTLKNGLEVILVQDKRLPVVAVNVWYHVGAANEEPGLTGFAHLFEHMMFAATKHVPRGTADRLLEGAGVVDSNGTTSFDRTNYFDTVPSNQLELALWIHADRMGFLLDVLDQTALSNQQDVVRNERRQSVENQPYGIVQEAVFHNLFPKAHPYHASIIGSHADIQAAKLDDIKRFFKRYYRPNNATLAIAGDVDKPRAKALVEKYFGGFARGEALSRIKIEQPKITEQKRVVIADRIELPRVIMAWHTPKAYAPGDIELSLAGQLFGGGKSSRLYRTLVYEQQIAQEVSAYQYSLGQGSIFFVDVTARPGHSAEQIERAIDVELDELRAGPIALDELARAVNVAETGLVSRFEKMGGFTGIADTLNHYNHYTGDPSFYVKELAAYRAATPETVQAAVKQHLANNARVIVHGVPGKQDLGAEVPTPPAPNVKPGEGTESLNKAEPWRANTPKPSQARALQLPKGDTFKLANGLTVIHVRKPGVPVVAANLVIKSGVDANPLDKSGLASYTAAMLDEGTNKRTALQIADAIAQLGASIGAAATSDATAVNAFSLKKNFPATLDLMAEIVLDPNFPNEEVERKRKSRLADLAQGREDPGFVAGTTMLAALYGRKHPYGFNELGSEEAIKQTTRDDLTAFWKSHYAPNNAALVLAGDLTRAEAEALARSGFGKWQAASIAPKQVAQPSRTKARLVIVDKPDAPQTALRVAKVGPDRSTPDYAAIEVMNAALGGLFTSRLVDNLREDKGYTYGAASAFQYRREPGPFAIRTSVRTDVTGAALKEIFKELDGLKTKPIAGEELAKARASRLLSLPGQFETAHSIASSLANTFVYSLGADYYARLPQKFTAVDGKAVHNAVGKYIKPDEMIVIAVGDRAKIEPQLGDLKLSPVEIRDADGNPK